MTNWCLTRELVRIYRGTCYSISFPCVEVHFFFRAICYLCVFQEGAQRLPLDMQRACYGVRAPITLPRCGRSHGGGHGASIGRAAGVRIHLAGVMSVICSPTLDGTLMSAPSAAGHWCEARDRRYAGPGAVGCRLFFTLIQAPLLTSSFAARYRSSRLRLITGKFGKDRNPFYNTHLTFWKEQKADGQFM